MNLCSAISALEFDYWLQGGEEECFIPSSFRFFVNSLRNSGELSDWSIPGNPTVVNRVFNIFRAVFVFLCIDCFAQMNPELWSTVIR